MAKKFTLRAIRINEGLSQEEVAEALNVSKTTVSNWETGKTSIRNSLVPALLNLYGVEYEDVNFFEEKLS